MSSLRRGVAGLAFLAGAVAWGAEALLPPLTGEVSGNFKALALPGAAAVRWKLTLRDGPSAPERVAELAIEGPGLRARGEVRLAELETVWWTLAEAEIDLAQWFGAVSPELSAQLREVSASGKVSVTGEGVLQGGVLGGRAKLSLREGRFDDPAHKLMLEGISVDVEIEDLATQRTAPAQVFTWRSGRYDVVALGVGRIEFAMDVEQVRITSALIDVFGGELRVGSLVMATNRPEFSVDARMVGVAVDQIMFLLPPVLAEARGKLDGNMDLSRDSDGVKIGNSRLGLREGETADLRLAVKPGWLSTSLPPAVMKYFPGFRKIENGEIPIRARELEIVLTPQGDAEGRTGHVHIAGGSSDPQFTAPLDMRVNIRGSLDSLVKLGAELGTDTRLRFGSPNK